MRPSICPSRKAAKSRSIHSRRKFLLLATTAVATAVHEPSALHAGIFVEGPASGVTTQFTTPRATISESGIAVGTLISGGISRATWWDASTPAGTTLPTQGFTNTFGIMMGDNGVAVGYGTTSPITNAIRWDNTSTGATLGSLTAHSGTGAVDSRAAAINASGVTVGYSELYSGTTLQGKRAVSWASESTTPTLLQLGSSNSSGFGNAQARAISNNGWIAGDGDLYESDVAKGTRGLIWQSNGTLSLTLNAVSVNAAGSGFVQVNGVNNSGTVIGNSRKYSGNTDLGLRAVRWEAGSSTATELGVLGTLPSGANVDTTAIAVDSFGNVAGLSQKYVGGASKGTRPVVWYAGQTEAVELEILGEDVNGATRGNMSAMNSFGFIAGTMQSYAPDNSNIGRRAVVWDLTTTEIYNLNDLFNLPAGWTLTVATDINDAGWVSGYATFDPTPLNTSVNDTYERYFSLQYEGFAVPEPAGALLLLGGLAGTALRRRRA